MWPGHFGAVLWLLTLLAFWQQATATDSEVVEAETRNPIAMLQLPINNPYAMLVKPYNILEATCPQGYVLANKHCHKRVRGASPMSSSRPK